MRAKLALALIGIVVLPLGLLGWLGARAVRDERARIEWSLRELAESRLEGVDTRIQGMLGATTERLLPFTRLESFDPDTLRQQVRSTPEVDHLFVLAPDGSIVFPPLGGDLSTGETSFLVRIRHFFKQGLPEALIGNEESMEQRIAVNDPGVERFGWYPWYWDNGLNLLFWRQDVRGRIVGAEINRMRLLADVIAALPSSEVEDSSFGPKERVSLRNANGDTVYRWGASFEEGVEIVGTARSMAFPLAAWSLLHERPLAATLASANLFWIGGLMIIGAVLVGLAVFLYRETGRELREARQRVRFSNQVSHELRTPLTNIRLYAELLESSLDEKDVVNHERLNVIVAESQRLSRMINNVLTFARRQRDELIVHPQNGDIDDVIRYVADQYRPALTARGIFIELELSAPLPTIFDRDAVEQILGNLLSNLEKYAPNSRIAVVQTVQEHGVTFLRVVDEGPGIPASHKEAVFEPFIRLDDRITEGVSGTGIGLSIARELARMQGGDLRLISADRGACFELELPAADPPEVIFGEAEEEQDEGPTR